jgi:hypothetical protein
MTRKHKDLTWASILSAIALLAVVLLAPVQASALEAETSDQSGWPLTSEQIEKLKTDAQTRAATAKERADQARSKAEQRREAIKSDAQMRLSAVKQKVCTQRQASISNILDRIGQRGTKHIEVIDKISERTQAFYKERGLTVANYDSLVANVASAKATADAAAKSVSDAQPGFECEKGNPKLMTDDYKALVQARTDAIKAYRDEVKALIVAVKAAAV